MATQRLIRNLTNTATGGTVAADDYLALSGATNDGRKILVSEVANYVATEEGGSTLAQLSSGKVPASQLPSGFDAGNYLGLWDANANSPALSNGSGTQGDYYIVGTAGTTSIDGISSWAVGDEIRANASAWEKLTPGTTAVTQGGTGATTAEGARTNLEVDSKDEIAEGLTRGEPSLYFNGSNESITGPTSTELNFATATDDLPFAISAWVKADDWFSGSTQVVAEKDGSNGGWYFRIAANGKLHFSTQDASSTTPQQNEIYIESSSILGDLLTDGTWANITAVIPGSGPNSDSAFTAALDNVSFYVNGNAIGMGSPTAKSGGSVLADYDGRPESNTDTLYFGAFGTSSGNFQGEIRDVQIFNTALTADQVEQVYRSGVPYELSQASFSQMIGNTFTNNGSAPYDTFTASGLDITAISDGSATAACYSDEFTLVKGKRYKVSFNYTENSRSGTDFRLKTGTSTSLTSSGGLNELPTGDHEFVATASGAHRLGFRAGSGVSVDFEISNLSFTEVGAILDLNAADVTGTNLPDRSGNGFNGTLSNMSVADNAVNLPPVVSTYHPNPASGEALLTLGNGGSGSDFSVDEDWTGTWTPGLSFGGNPAGNVYSLQEGHFSKVGNIVIATFAVALSSKGSGSGTARISGLPFLGKTIAAANLQSGAIGFASGFSGLVGALSGLIQSNQDDIILTQHGGATGTSTISDTEFTSSSELRGTFIYLTD